MRLVRGFVAVLFVLLLGLGPAAAQGIVNLGGTPAPAPEGETAPPEDDIFGFTPRPATEVADAPVRTTPCKQCEPLAGMYNAANDRIAFFTEVAQEQAAAEAAIDTQIAATEDLLRAAQWQVTKWRGEFRKFLLNRQNDKTDEAFRQFEAAEARVAEIEALLKQLGEQKEAQARRRAETQAEIEMWQGELARIAAELEECERLCKERGGISTVTDDGFVRTWCTVCSALESALNDTIGSRRTISGLIEQARAELAPLEAARDELIAAERSAIAAADAAIQQLAAGPNAAAEAALSAASQNLLDLEGPIEQAHEAVSPAAEKLAALEAYRDQLAQLEAQQRAALAECEKNCAQPLEEMPDPAANPGTAPVDDPGFVTTDCPACEATASLLNDTVGSLINLRADLATAQADLAAAEEQLAGLEAEERAALDAASAAIQDLARLGDAAAGDSAAARDSALKRVNELQDAIADTFIDKLDPARSRVEQLEAEIERLEALEKSLREQLADCEKTCQAAPAEEPAVMPDPVPEASSPFVTTDCPACEALASLLNDTVGTLVNLREQLVAAESALSAAQESLADLEAEERAALDAADSAIQELAALGEASTPDADAITRTEAARDAALKRIEELQQEMDDTFVDDVDPALAQIRQLRAEIERLEALEKSLREQLEACEKNCQAAPAEDPAAMPDPVPEAPTPFVTTDCPACETLASLLNDAIGTLGNLRADRVAAQQALDEAMDQLAEMQLAQRAALDGANAAIQREAELGPNGDPAALAEAASAKTEALESVDELETQIDEFFAETVGPAEERVASLDAQIESLETLEASLRDKLADCERNCAEPVDETALAVPEPEPLPDGPATVTTDCPQCEDLAAALRQTMERLAAKGRELDSAAAALAEAREQLTEAETGAAEALEEGAMASTDAVNAENAGDSAGAQAARERQTEAFLRAAELMDRADDLNDTAIASLESAVESLTAEFNELVSLATQQRAALEECEKACGGQATGLRNIPDFRVALQQQDEECERGEVCTIGVTFTNSGGAHDGSLFISTDFSLLLPDGGMLGDAFCSNAAKGKGMCYYPDVDVEEGGTLTLILPALPELGVCVTLEEPYEKDFGVSAWVQFGLTMEGYSPGTIDGQIGRKTLAAVEEFLEAEDAPAPVGLSNDELRELMRSVTPENGDRIEAEIFDRLFGEQPRDAEDREDMLDCIELRLTRDTMTRQPEEGTGQPVEDAPRINLPAPAGPGVGLELKFGEQEEQEHEEFEPRERELRIGPELELPGLGGFGF